MRFDAGALPNAKLIRCSRKSASLTCWSFEASRTRSSSGSAGRVFRNCLRLAIFSLCSPLKLDDNSANATRQIFFSRRCTFLDNLHYFLYFVLLPRRPRNANITAREIIAEIFTYDRVKRPFDPRDSFGARTTGVQGFHYRLICRGSVAVVSIPCQPGFSPWFCSSSHFFRGAK